MRWSAFAATLAPADHARLLGALEAGTVLARLASAVPAEDGEVEAAVQHLTAALELLGQARQLLTASPPAPARGQMQDPGVSIDPHGPGVGYLPPGAGPVPHDAPAPDPQQRLTGP